MNLYNLDEEYKELLLLLEETEGELTPELEESLNINEENFANKLKNYIFIIRQLEANATMFANEAKQFSAKAKSLISRSELLEEKIKNSLITRGLEEVKTELHTIKFRDSEYVDIDNIDILPAQYTKVSIEPNKTLINKALKEGILIEGASLKKRQNLSIK